MKEILLLLSLAVTWPVLANAEPVATPNPACAKPTNTCMVNLQADQPCVGGPEDDVIFGSGGDDVISGGGGNDRILGGGGNDTICGGEGDDMLLGESGDDILYGDGGSDVLSGFDGNDTCIGGSVTSNCEVTKAPASADPAVCSRILGRWQWFDNGTVIFNSDNTVQWYTPMTFQKGHSAKWTCDAQKKTFTIPWTNGFTDVMSVIASGDSLQGKNNRGMTIWAQRHK